MTTLKDYYHLRDRDSFAINPRRDREVYFGGSNINSRIRERLETDFLEERAVPKFFIFGQYGAGKTHTLGHIEYVLGATPFSSTYPTEVRMTELPPLRAKDNWAKIHVQLVDVLGRDIVRSAAKALARRAPEDVSPEDFFREKAVPFGDTSLRASQAKIYQALQFSGRTETVAWDWLKGRKLTADEKNTLGVETDLASAPDCLNALLNLATLIHQGLNRKLVLLIDEGEAMRSITDPGSEEEFTVIMRKIMDNDNDVLGMIVAFQNEGGMEAAPEMFADESVRRRVGFESGYIDLTSLVSDPGEIKDFVTSVLDRLIDQDAARAKIGELELDVDPGMFPFTPDAIDALAEYLVEDPGRQVPSQIISKMSTAVAQAYRKGQRDNVPCQLVDDDIINSVLYPDQDGLV